ncbi:MAG: tetratricopeptide repeat protein [Bacteroidota bacterium]
MGFDLFAQSFLIDSLNQQAYLSYREDVEEAKTLAYQALTLAERAQLTPQIVDSYINLGRCFRLSNQWDSAYQALELAIKLGKEVGYNKGLIQATNNLGICYRVQGKTEEAHPWFEQSLAIAQQIGDQKGEANALNNLFVVAQEQEKYDSAFVYLSGAMHVYQQIGDSSGIARIYANQAFMFNLLEQNDSAIFYTFKALRIQDALGLTYQQADSYNLIGDLYAEKGQHNEALEYWEQALELFHEIGDLTELAITYNNIGSALVLLKKYPEAKPYLEKGIELAQQTEDPFMIGSTLVSLSGWFIDQDREVHLARGMLEEAVIYLQEANSNNLADAYNSLGRLEMQQGKANEAKKWFEKELDLARESEDLQNQSIALYNLVTVYESQGKSQEALGTLWQYQDVKDSLLRIETEESFNQERVKYETEKKEKENLQLQYDLSQSELATAEQKALRNQIMGIAAIVLLLSLGGFIWYRYRQRIRIKEQKMALEQERARKEQERKEAEKLRELDAMKTRFFTNISHEFRTPLTLILGQNEQLQSAIDDQRLQNRLDMVGRNGHRLLDLVNQVLDVAKIEAGGMELERSRLDAIPFLKHMLYSFESMAEEKEIDLIFESNLQDLDTAFDHKKIERVIFNLLSNAMKFTPAGGSVRMQVQEKAKQLHIAITDSGVGIKANQLPYIFDRFYQADSSDNQPQPGTGIGLSLVKELVELHGGNISVDSELNQGTTFRIALPIPENLSDYEAAVPENHLNPEALPNKTIANTENTPYQDKKTEHILLIEDNPDVRAFVKEQIRSFGYQVSEASDGQEGLEKAQEIIPDLIISDIMMPRLDGYGVAKGLKEDQRTSHIPVVLLTSKASDESKIAGLELGIDDYLLKPFNARELEIRIRNLIEQRKRLRERFSSATIIRPNEVSAVSMDQSFLKKVLESIESNLSDEQFSVEVLGKQVGLSVNHLNRKLSALIDQTAGKLIRSMRLQRAADLIKQEAASISEIAYDTGFSSPAHFTRSFKQQFGMSPTAYQKSGG